MLLCLSTLAFFHITFLLNSRGFIHSSAYWLKIRVKIFEINLYIHIQLSIKRFYEYTNTNSHAYYFNSNCLWSFFYTHTSWAKCCIHTYIQTILFILSEHLCNHVSLLRQENVCSNFSLTAFSNVYPFICVLMMWSRSYNIWFTATQKHYMCVYVCVISTFDAHLCMFLRGRKCYGGKQATQMCKLLSRTCSLYVHAFVCVCVWMCADV